MVKTQKVNIRLNRTFADLLLADTESQPRTIPEMYWERVVDKLDCVLQGCSHYWPQYDAERLRVFARALDEVRDQCRTEGLID